MEQFNLAVMLFLACWQACPADAADGTKLPFDAYSGYFVSNRFEPDVAGSFAVISDQKRL